MFLRASHCGLPFFYVYLKMTDILDITLGNRQSGKTSYILQELFLNLKKYPHNKHLFFTTSDSKRYIKKEIENIYNLHPNIKIYPETQLSYSLKGHRDVYVYFDDFDFFEEKYKSHFFELPLSTPKKIYIATTPKFLRKDKDLNINHTKSSDPLIFALQCADFKFNFLFNKNSAFTYLNSGFNNKEKFMTEGLGLLTKFDY